MTTNQSIRIGWIGTGIMGSGMAGHLLEAGHAVSVFTRTKSKAATLLEKGARWKPSVEAVATDCDLVFIMVGYPADVHRVILGDPQNPAGSVGGLLDSCHEGEIIVDMSTGSPTAARELAARCSRRGVTFLDAPVSGGDLGARNATLSIMVGGDRRGFDAVLPLFELMGKTIVHHGESGCGQHAKMVNQTLIAGNMIGVCEALLYAQKAGLEMDRVLASVERGAAGSWSLSNLVPRMLSGDYAPGFMIEHFLKDMGIALEEAARMRLALPGLALVRELYTAAAANGFSREGTQALWKVLAKMNGME